MKVLLGWFIKYTGVTVRRIVSAPRRIAHERVGAFTLLELMVVVVILGILAAFVVPRISKRPEDARVTKARIEISNLEQALELYYLDNGIYPTTEQGLRALIEKPQTGDEPVNWKAGGYLAKSKLPRDPWGNEYVYLSPGDRNPDFDLSSLGKDGVEGGEEYDTDITNWD
jgi:general secretion pathway protein G